FLHYRSGAFMMARSAKDQSVDALYDAALSISASADDPISGGRHKVWGSKKLWVLPQTSTIASHLPKAMGTAVAMEQAKRLNLDLPIPDDSIVVCSFGDASSNHATALTAFNATQWTAFQNLPVPVVYVCEDNGLGISVHTPRGWVEANFKHRPGLDYFQADGLDVIDTYAVTKEAIEHCRRTRRPVFLHLKLSRLLGHAGTDMETEYRSVDAIEKTEANDPLILTAKSVLQHGLRSADEIYADYVKIRNHMRSAALKAAKQGKQTDASEIMQPQAPYDQTAVETEAKRRADIVKRVAVFGSKAKLPENAKARHLSIQLNRALHDLMCKYPEMTLFGEDVAQKGGVYTVSSGLAKTFKGNRVFNTLLDETTILGMAQGAAYMGLLPVPEIQYLAYLHNALDQIRGEACSLQFFSQDQYSNGMVVRVASLAYQKGFGGHFHNDNSITALRDIPSLIIACPSRGDDAVRMLRTCTALAKVNGRVVAFLEPIALYMRKDLYADKDEQWVFAYPPAEDIVSFGSGRIYNEQAAELLIITYGNGVPMSLRASKALNADTRIRILDLRWLKPLNTEYIVEQAKQFAKVLVVDEGRATGGVSEEIFTLLDEHCPEVKKARVTGKDSFIPLGAAANLVLVSEAEIQQKAQELLKKN
ncbi:MAG: MFS transporter, partial [Gammaproteobacteria bacterium]|nr:MFS transporter [Gammaproteobacteria bacterium]